MLVMRTHMWYNIINHMAVGESVFAGSEPSGGETYAEIVEDDDLCRTCLCDDGALRGVCRGRQRR